MWLNPHILAKSAIADVDGDGQEKLVVAVSYFFDAAQYSRLVGCHPDLFQLCFQLLLLSHLPDQCIDQPAIADVHGDGQEELVVAVSYFFGADQYSHPVGCHSNCCNATHMLSSRAQSAIADIDGDAQE